jgi:hypothetical protein
MELPTDTCENATDLADQYLNNLQNLCIPDTPKKIDLKSINFGLSFAPRSSSLVKVGRGDTSPALIENEDDFTEL